MHYYKAFGLNILSEIVLPELNTGDQHASVDLHIKAGKIQLPKLSKTHIYRRDTRAAFGQSEDNLFLFWDSIASFRAQSGSLLIVDAFTNDTNLTSLFTVSEALGLILFQRGMFLLHSSSVLVGSEAWCFMGSPGAGKSSTAAAFIKAGCRLLSDDLTAIQIGGDNMVNVVPAYPQLKIWNKTVEGLGYKAEDLHPVSEGIDKYAYLPKATFEDQPVALGRLIFLHKAKNRAALSRPGISEIPPELIKHFPLPVALLSAEYLQRHFIQTIQCAKHAEVLKMRRPEGFENLEKWVEESLELSISKQ
ncbi:phosphoenolpyruvate carboxykinase (ATP) [Dyadobacter aurulentus]|uniref:serine kinase n=1 Tax=Dyadobacter sp. UC 10 TaxID=2605428 RepID=UPI0011F144C8|nr:serine kinase [Dyadobacter sp. UC 10]KAA0989419.1 serine kinase [Dyadobacter sp. UC 10]